MTWSIVARDLSGAFGIAIASRFFAVGALCPHARSGVGALSTQALMNPLLPAPALLGLAQGREPSALLADLMAQDPGRAHRQFHMVDAQGRAAAHTGDSCIDWCGHMIEADFSVAGNMLAGPLVIAATAESFRNSEQHPFAARLIRAMAAGEAAGGDKRGKQAAALLIYSGQDYAALDLRVDDHAEPLVELQRLYDVSLERFQPFVACLATRENPGGTLDRQQIEAEIVRFHAARQAGGKTQ